ncbi:MAG: beta strand repeat-containing protein, partial [Sandarakinorhabdus sp.]
IETSGRFLTTQGAYGSAAARFGSAGTWLLDPYDVEIVAASAGGNGPNLVNPGFEQGLTGWTILGSGGTQVVSSVQASNGTTYTSQISSGGNFALLTGDAANQENGVAQTFMGTAGQSFTLYALFIGQDSLPFNDYGRVTLLQPNAATLTLYSRDISQVGDEGTAPWESSTVNLSMTGNYTIKAFAANDQDDVAPPSLGFELGVASSSSSANGMFGAIFGTQVWTPNGTASKIDVSQITGFLNAGTNVRITTGPVLLGSEAGNITVKAAIAKTSGATANLQLDATNGIFVNQAISSSSNQLNVILNAGAGGITLGAGINTNGGQLTLKSTGAVNQSAALSTDVLALTGAGGNYSLSHPGNSFNTLSANTGTVTLQNSTTTHVGTVTTSGALNLASAGALAIDGAVSVGGVSQLKSGSSVQIASTGSVAASANVSLIAATDFINARGSSAITTSNGARWLVYSQTPANDSFGGLVSGNQAIWNTPASTAPSSISESGNRYVFALQPTVTIAGTTANKIYGDVFNGAAAGAYTVSGLINASTYNNVFAQDVLTGLPSFSSSGAGVTASVGTYSTVFGQSTLGGVNGYAFNFANGQLIVDRRSLVATLTGTVSRAYDGGTAATLSSGNYALSGVVNGDTVALNNPVSGSFDSKT